MIDKITFFICLLFIHTLIFQIVLITNATATEIWKKSINQKYIRNYSLDGEVNYILSQNNFNKSYAFVIGIGDYNNSDWNKLESSYFDAIKIRDYLCNVAGFDYVHILTNNEASKKTINKLMEETFPNLLKNNDRFVFYFSGHGTQRVVGDLTFGYLVMKDSSEESYGNMISMEDIERWDSLIYRAKHVLFILDSCFSGLAGFQSKSLLKKNTIERLSQYSHYLITAGSADEESVASVSKWGGSLFTDSFIKAISGNADLSSKDYEYDGVVSLVEIIKYIGDRIDFESFKINKNNPFSKKIFMSPQISQLQTSKGQFYFTINDFKIESDDKSKFHSKVKEEHSEIFKSKSINENKLQRSDNFIPIQLRNKALKISEDDVKKMVKEHGFFDNRWNKTKSIENIYNDQKNGTILDQATGLIWQKFGSKNTLTKNKAYNYVEKLNNETYANRSNWRVPTLEELATLLQKSSINDIYISDFFGENQSFCWSSDYVNKKYSWIAHFYSGILYFDRNEKKCFVRAVSSLNKR